MRCQRIDSKMCDDRLKQNVDSEKFGGCLQVLFPRRLCALSPLSQSNGGDWWTETTSWCVNRSMKNRRNTAERKRASWSFSISLLSSSVVFYSVYFWQRASRTDRYQNVRRPIERNEDCETPVEIVIAESMKTTTVAVAAAFECDSVVVKMVAVVVKSCSERCCGWDGWKSKLHLMMIRRCNRSAYPCFSCDSPAAGDAGVYLIDIQL